MRGKFITVEGPDGAVKPLITRLSEHLMGRGKVKVTREPGALY